MKQFLCRGCGCMVEVANIVEDVYCRNEKCPYGPCSKMDIVEGSMKFQKVFLADTKKKARK